MRLVLLIKKIENFSVVSYTLLVLLLSILVSFFSYGITLFLQLFAIDKTVLASRPMIELSTNFFTLISICIIAPLFETFVAQYLPLRFLKKYLPIKVLIICSSLIFALLHPYSLGYIVNTFLIGIIFSVGYVLWKKTEVSHPFWIIVSVHSLKNLLAFILQLLNI